jgi:hypothetical protein
MDECLPRGSLDAATLAMLLEKERRESRALRQELARLTAGLARQNRVIAELERRDAARQEELAEQRRLTVGLTEQNTLLRQRIAAVELENARLRGVLPGRAPTREPEVRPAVQPREQTPRKKRAGAHNRGRRQQLQPTRWETHAAKQCPQCGTALSGGWIVRRVCVVDLPACAPLAVTQHRIIRRQCPRCGKRVTPRPVGVEAGRIGRSCFGPRLMAAIAVMATLERLPGRMIGDRLAREYGLQISHGAICGVLHRLAHNGMPRYAELQAAARASPVVHADETGWRENGQHSTVWTVCTPELVTVHHGRRTNAMIDGILGADFPGTLVSDCYAAYDHFPGAKQRCWAHLVRELEALLQEHSTTPETVAWVEGILALYQQARARRPAAEEGETPQAVGRRERRAQSYEALLLQLCPATLDPRLPHATLAKRLRSKVAELFTFVRDPTVPATNNAAERSLRPLVIARKISGGTRSPAGSTTRMILYSLAATERLHGRDPAALFHALALTPPGLSLPS